MDVPSSSATQHRGYKRIIAEDRHDLYPEAEVAAVGRWRRGRLLVADEADQGN